MLWRALAAVVGLMPWAWLGGLGRALGWLAGGLLRIRRGHVEQALERAGITPCAGVAASVYASLGMGVFEFLWMAGRRGQGLDQIVSVPEQDWARIEQARARGRGLIVAAAHTGNWDLLACAMASRVPLAIITKRLHWRSLDRFWQQTRGGLGARLLDPQAALGEARELLKQNGVVVFLIDQAPERKSGVVVADFLGAPARHDAAFAMLAARTGASVALAFDERLETGQHLCRIPAVWQPPERAGRPWAEKVCLQFNAMLEGFVRERPGQWLWLHKRWKLVSLQRAQRPVPQGS